MMSTLDRRTAVGDSRIKTAPAISGMRSPKRSAGADKDSRAKWFRYYASFSAGFVEDAIEYLDLKPGAILLDPWLGTGTTSEIAIAKGYQIRGYDLNPATLLVARARLLATETAADVSALVEQISHTYEHGVLQPERATKSRIDDPLEQWLQPASARAFRVLESSVAAVASNCSYSSASPIWKNAGQVPPTIAFLLRGSVSNIETFRFEVSKFQSNLDESVKGKSTHSTIEKTNF